MKKYTEEELQKILDDHKLWLSNEGGIRADLSCANLSGANLLGANLYGANLSHADLSGADLSNANLSGADLYYADLIGTNLANANLSYADLIYADLTDADLTDAKLNGTDLSNATFDNTLMLGKPVNKAPVQLSYYPYHVLITDTMMQIGCKVHSIDAWLAFTVEEINEMDDDAKYFYEKYGKIIQDLAISQRVPKEENKES